MNNTLDYEKFKFYLQQDFLYVVDCTRALLIIAAKFNDVEIMNKLICVAVGTFATRDYYSKHFADCGLSDSHKIRDLARLLLTSSYVLHIIILLLKV
jgi:thiaminase/transcriptional activator TenA